MAVKPKQFLNYLFEYKVDNFFGVPDSLLKELCLCIDDNVPKNQHIIAAPIDAKTKTCIRTKELFTSTQKPTFPLGQNTSIGVIMTNAKLSKSQNTKLAQVAHNGLAKCIDPIHTNYDGDTLFALSSQKIENQHDTVLFWVSDVVCEAVLSIFN